MIDSDNPSLRHLFVMTEFRRQLIVPRTRPFLPLGIIDKRIPQLSTNLTSNRFTLQTDLIRIVDKWTRRLNCIKQYLREDS